MDQHGFRKLISGQTAGTAALLLRLLLGCAAAVYKFIVAVRNAFYSAGVLKNHRVKTPVISVGNITTGGTGKTPLVIWLCNFLQSQGSSCTVLTRGYKAGEITDAGISRHSDEPAIIESKCPGTKVIVDSNRVRGAHKAIEYGAQALVMDDGFQHRRLQRDLDILTIDATCPFGYGRMLPAGLLREPLGSVGRADAAVITHCDLADEERLLKIEQSLKKVNPDIVLARSVHRAVAVRFADGEEKNIDQLKAKKVFAFCGIGNPQAFFTLLKNAGCQITGSKIFDDHHRYGKDDIVEIASLAKASGAGLILCTHKDLTKINTEEKCDEEIKIAFIEIEIAFAGGEEDLRELIRQAIAGKIR